jgi:hypothetical protein
VIALRNDQGKTKPCRFGRGWSRFALGFFLLFGAFASAQSIEIGIKGGLRATGDFESGLYATSESKRYALGPMVTIGVPLGFKAEFDALYRRVAFRTGNSDILGDSFTQRGTANSWEFPMLVRHNLIGGFYGAVGYAPRVINGSSHVNLTNGTPPLVAFHSYTAPDPYQTTHGLVVAGGLDTRFGPIYLSPEVRYTHWSSPALNVQGSHGYGYQMSQEQVDVLVGISFHPFDRH